MGNHLIQHVNMGENQNCIKHHDSLAQLDNVEMDNVLIIIDLIVVLALVHDKMNVVYVQVGMGKVGGQYCDHLQ